MSGALLATAWHERLKLPAYDRHACLAALRGEEIPHALGHPLHRLCVVRGIRYNHGFGLELRDVTPVFTRRLNARSIMSNIIPDLNHQDQIPYCIWHPEVASQDTYRELVRRYPHMVYQVGRACAVAGYTQLYHELDILPDVHIAEEARECGNLDIYEVIMSQPVRYNVMNDYMRSVDTNSPQPAHLNGDTIVCWMLDIKQEFHDASSEYRQLEDGMYVTKGLWDSMGYKDTTFNITEDMHIDEHESDEKAQRLLANRPSLKLLHQPLPLDLPTVQKEILIVMAAYYGDVDRYARLRRPEFVEHELFCCVRGIYHNTMFARWWMDQPEPKPNRIKRAINARFIMNNVLSAAPYRLADTPYLIWWPSQARPSTYRRLAELQPAMLPQIIRACIYAGNRTLFDKLLPLMTPDKNLIREAEEQGDIRFRQALQDRIKFLGIEGAIPPSTLHWQEDISDFIGLSSVCVGKYLVNNTVGTIWEGQYDGWQCDGSAVELMVCLPEDWMIGEEEERNTYDLDYGQGMIYR